MHVRSFANSLFQWAWNKDCVTSFRVDGNPDFCSFIRIDEGLLGDGHSYSPKAIHSWLTRAMYSRRSKMNLLWNTMVIGGYADGERLILLTNNLISLTTQPLVPV